jgi:hypothetical protein
MKSAIVTSNQEKYNAVRKEQFEIREKMKHCRVGSVKHASLEAEFKRVSQEIPEDVFDMALFFPNIMEAIDKRIEDSEKNLQEMKDKFNADPLYVIEWRADNIASICYLLRDLNGLKRNLIAMETYHDFAVFFEEMMKRRQERLMNFDFSHSTSPWANELRMCEYEHMKRNFNPSQSYWSLFGRIADEIKECAKLHSKGKIINADKINNPFYVKPEEKV